MPWWMTLELVAAVVICVIIAPFIGLWVRRRWLSNRGGLFDCALRLRNDVEGAGWALGLARYEGNRLEWYRVFSLSFRPRLVLDRGTTTFVTRRDSDQIEALVIFSDHEVVQLQSTVNGQSKQWEMAMTPGSVVGLMSWLEAAPPGGHRYPGVE